jgi:hypothetical protein
MAATHERTGAFAADLKEFAKVDRHTIGSKFSIDRFSSFLIHDF